MKEKINSLELSSIFTLCIISSSIGLSLYTTIKMTGIDSYISVLIGALIGIIFLLIFFYIFNYESDKPIYEKNTHIFGKFFGNLLNIIIILLYLVIGGTILFNLSNFIVSQYLSDVPLLFILIILGAIIWYAVNKGIETIGRMSSLCIIVVLLFFIIGYVSIFKEIKLENIKPILEFGLKKPIIAGFINMLISLSPIYTILIFPKNNLVDKEKVTKYISIGYGVSAINLVILSFISNSILGKHLIKLYQYPGYISFKKISLFGFIDRIENFLSLHWILSSFVTLAMIMYYIKGTIKRKGNSKILNILIIGAAIGLSLKVFKNSTAFNNYIFKFYPYILSVLFGIYIIIAISILLRKDFVKEKIMYNKL